MNWLKTVWNRIVNNTSKTPTLVLVEEINTATASQHFENICVEAGVRRKDLVAHNIVSIFEEWYTGESREEDIKDSIPVFIEEHGGIIRAKLVKVLSK